MDDAVAIALKTSAVIGFILWVLPSTRIAGLGAIWRQGRIFNLLKAGA
jgi:hypothetical protein